MQAIPKYIKKTLYFIQSNCVRYSVFRYFSRFGRPLISRSIMWADDQALNYLGNVFDWVPSTLDLLELLPEERFGVCVCKKLSLK